MSRQGSEVAFWRGTPLPKKIKGRERPLAAVRRDELSHLL